MLRTSLSLLLGALAPALLPASAPAAWRAPVAGPPVARFHRTADRFAAGQRRGVDFTPRAGETVRSPCRGRVSFAGALPGGGLGVSLRCGRLTATVLHLGSVRVARAQGIEGGQPLGLAGETPIRLGARVTSEPDGYLDPLRLIAGGRSDRAPIPLAGPRSHRVSPDLGLPEVKRHSATVAPRVSSDFGLPEVSRHSARSALGRPTRPAPHSPPSFAALRRHPSDNPSEVAAAGSAQRDAPPAAWLGLALAAAALPGLARPAQHARRRRHDRAEGLASTGP